MIFLLISPPLSHEDTKEKYELFFLISKARFHCNVPVIKSSIKRIYYHVGDFVSWWLNSSFFMKDN